MTRWERFQAELKRVHADEEGASLVFAAITLFTLSMSIMFVYQMGLVSADRVQIQTAADAAAYSAAQVEANNLNAIGQINDALTYVNYILLRYTVDAIVYGTLYQFDSHQRPGTSQAKWVLMGDQEGYERYEHIKEIVQGGDGALKKGVKWAEELHTAGRLIMATTPRLCKETAAYIAGENGATHIGFSEDLDKAFQIGESGDAGFSEKAYSGSDQEFTPSMYGRYAEREVMEITDASGSGGQTQPKKRELPGQNLRWFNRAEGKLNQGSEYYAIRLCWNEKDWEHEGFRKGSQSLTMHGEQSYIMFMQGAPNGHWHEQHMHEKFDFMTGTWIPVGTHGGGRNAGGHWLPEDDDSQIHQQADDLYLKMGFPEAFHHKSSKCPTCMQGQGYAPGRPQGARSIYSEIKKSTRYAGSQHLKDAYELKFDRLGSKPKPLMLRAPALRAGITVVTWREARELGELFPKNKWGMVAVASAAVGYQTDQGVLPLSQMQNGRARYKSNRGISGNEEAIYHSGNNSNDNEYRNFFYGKDKKNGVRFGARLVPIAWKYTWHSANEGGEGNPQGLKALLQNQPQNGQPVWFRAGQRRNLQQEAPPSLNELRRFVTVNSQQGLKKFWH